MEQLLTSLATSLATFGFWRARPGRSSANGTTSDLRRWRSRLGESNSGPTHYECVALPTELRRRAVADGRESLLQRQPAESTGCGNDREPTLRSVLNPAGIPDPPPAASATPGTCQSPGRRRTIPASRQCDRRRCRSAVAR